MEDLLKSKKTEDRIRGMQLLLRSAKTADPTLLCKMLEDRSPYVAALAAECLGKCADLQAMRLMIDRFIAVTADGLRMDPGCHIRTNLAYAFAQLECHHAVPALRLGIRTVQIEPVGGVKYDTGAHLRGSCAQTLAHLHSREALRDITLLLFDHGTQQCGFGDTRSNLVEPRRSAARALGAMGLAEARVPLTLRLRYPEGECVEVLQECMQALVELEDPDLEDVLHPYLSEEQLRRCPDLAVYAGLMLARGRVPGAEATLEKLAGDMFGNGIEAAVLALVSLQTPEAAEALNRLAEHDRRAVRDVVQRVRSA